MKVCEKCGEEIYTKDGENKCQKCEEGVKSAVKRKARKQQRESRDQLMKSLGLVKVRGALGGVYYE